MNEREYKEAIVDLGEVVALFDMLIHPKENDPPMRMKIAVNVLDRAKRALTCLRDVDYSRTIVAGYEEPIESLEKFIKPCPLCGKAAVKLQEPWGNDEEWIIYCPIEKGAGGCGLELSREHWALLIYEWNRHERR